MTHCPIHCWWKFPLALNRTQGEDSSSVDDWRRTRKLRNCQVGEQNRTKLAKERKKETTQARERKDSRVQQNPQILRTRWLDLYLFAAIILTGENLETARIGRTTTRAKKNGTAGEPACVRGPSNAKLSQVRDAAVRAVGRLRAGRLFPTGRWFGPPKITDVANGIDADGWFMRPASSRDPPTPIRGRLHDTWTTDARWLTQGGRRDWSRFTNVSNASWVIQVNRDGMDQNLTGSRYYLSWNK